MRIAVRTGVALLLVSLIAGMTASADAQKSTVDVGAIVDGLRIQLGSDEAAIRNAYGMTGPLQPVKPGVTSLRSPADGIWFFFNSDGLNNNIRLEAPFGGLVRGIRIDDTRDVLIAKLGSPLRPTWKFGQDTAYIYDLNDIAQIRFDVSPDQKVVRMFVLLRKLLSENVGLVRVAFGQTVIPKPRRQA